MTDAIWYCKCGFKCLEATLAKTDGVCPVCKKGAPAMVAKYGGA